MLTFSPDLFRGYYISIKMRNFPPICWFSDLVSGRDLYYSTTVLQYTIVIGNTIHNTTLPVSMKKKYSTMYCTLYLAYIDVADDDSDELFEDIRYNLHTLDFLFEHCMRCPVPTCQRRKTSIWIARSGVNVEHEGDITMSSCIDMIRVWL